MPTKKTTAREVLRNNAINAGLNSRNKGVRQRSAERAAKAQNARSGGRNGG